MAKHLQDSFMREIEEDLRDEHYAKLWKKYGTYIIMGAIALVALVAGYQGWRHYDITNRNELGEKFATAQNLILENKRDEAEAALSALAAGSNSGYAMMARFQSASLKALNSGSAEGFNDLAADSSIDAIYRDVAVLLAVTYESGAVDSRQLMQRLEPLRADANPWRYSARELYAVLAMRAGDVDVAREVLKKLSEDAATPQGMRARATELLASIGQ